MTPIDSLIAAKSAIAASEAAELAKDYLSAFAYAGDARAMLEFWQEELSAQHEQQRRDKGLADVTEVMAEAYRADNRQ